MALTVATLSAGASPAVHPVSRHSPVIWDNGIFPTAVPTRGVPDGPLAANGDLGVTLGGVVVPGSAIGSPGAGAQGLIPADNQNASFGSLGMYFGKNDFWGWPRAVTYHASFQHFSPGYLLIGLADALHHDPIALKRFTGSMSLENGHISATASGDSGHSLTVGAVVLASQNTVLANVTATCPSGSSSGSVGLTVTLSSDTIFGMPLNTSVGPGDGALHLTKENVADDGLAEPVLVPCQQMMIIYNSIRTFKVSSTGALTAHNTSGGPPLCLALQPETQSAAVHRAVTVRCSAASAAPPWVLRDGELTQTAKDGTRWCLTAHNISQDGTTTCPGGPKQSYYTDPSADGACQSTSFSVNVSRCPTTPSSGSKAAWSFDPATGFLAATNAPSVSGKCLALVGPRQTNHLALTTKLSSASPGAILTDAGVDAGGGSSAAVAKRQLKIKCGATVQLTVGVATQRDMAWWEFIGSAADKLAAVEPAEVGGLLAAHEVWWHDFWNASAVSLGEWKLIEKNCAPSRPPQPSLPSLSASRRYTATT